MSDWPNHPSWAALKSGPVTQDGEQYVLSVVDCGELYLPTGAVGCCDPFVELDGAHVFARVKPGRYPVKLTLADVSGQGDGSHIREAYGSLLLRDGVEVERRPIGQAPDEVLEPGEYVGFGVDAGTACFVDAEAAARDLAEEGWYSEVDEDGEPQAFHVMDDPEHIRDGVANLPYPGAQEGVNVVLFHSGWGDGFYPVVGSFDADGELLAIHIDLQVVGPDEEE